MPVHITKKYLEPSVLVSGSTISWDVAFVRQPILTLAHSATVELSNLEEGQTVSLSGTMGGVGYLSLDIEHVDLTVFVMGGDLGAISGLDVGGLFEISCKRIGNQLRVWVSVLET